MHGNNGKVVKQERLPICLNADILASGHLILALHSITMTALHV